MNQFAQLRRNIYLTHEPGDVHGFRRLAAALTGEPELLDPVLDAMARLHAGAAFGSCPAASTAQLEAEIVRYLGTSPYVDRYLADALRNRGELQSALRQSAADPALTGATVAVAVAAELRPFEAGWTADALQRGGDPELIVDLLCYVAAAGLVELRPRIRALLDSPLPWAVRAEALLTLQELERTGDGTRHGLGAASAATSTADPQVPDDLVPAAASGEPCRTEGARPPAARLAQSMFYGDPGRMGKGGSGGIGTLVRELGATLARDYMPVVTLVCYNSRARSYPLQVCEELAPGHLVVRLPLFLAGENPAGFLRAEHRIERAVERALRTNRGRYGAIHVRFLDNASRAVARVARRNALPLVTTLTADPHRTVCSPEGTIRRADPESARELFNRILIGDQLLGWSNGVVAIGRNAFAGELLDYFPQLEDTRGKTLAAIDEGVSTAPPAVSVDVAGLLCDRQAEPALSPRQLDDPVLISVGRLSPVKGQVNLVQAWAQSDLWRRYNLVLIGGDFATPTDEEQLIRRQIHDCRRPELDGRFCHLPAQQNPVVRAVLAWCAARTSPGGADIYVCPSLKEEFGLSILEAMAAGLPVCAPLRGGPQTYLRHGINGFLIDTRDAGSLRRELCALLTAERTTTARLHEIKQQARRTIRERYSLAAMGREYERLYRRVAADSEKQRGEQ
ncbi:MAG: glycosyltransferase [Spirochaetaceae bacterium]|nr:MAG: glycosyltransferase [Spirochaetaceae bacterium]